MNTLLDIAKSAAIDVGLEPPVTVQGDDPDATKLVHFINATGQEAIRRVDWHVLNETAVINGDGTVRMYLMPDDFSRLQDGMSVKFAGMPLRGSLSLDEWASLTHAAGTPRYYLLRSNEIGFYPTLEPMANATVSYQSKNWATDSANVGKASLDLDGDKAILPAELLAKGAVWRWLRHAGRDYADHMAEYETMLIDYARATGGVRQP